MEGKNLEEIPARALNFSNRLLLAQYLNPEQQLPSKNGCARDYRGAAELMGFDYNDIRNFQRHDNPTLKVLEVWTVQSNATIGQLIESLKKMDRHDIIQDMQTKFENDAAVYLQRSRKVSIESPLQVPEITSCPISDSRVNDSGILTTEDANTGEYTVYDAYVCYADEDIGFVYELVKFLESVGFKLFLRHRDMLAGHKEYDTSLQLIQERCKRVLIILSEDFMKCPAYEAQASFAAGLGIDERCRKLIPIVYRPCEIPVMLKFISKIDFTKPGCVIEWVWDKVISSLRDGPSSTFISPERRYPSLGTSLPQIALGSSDSAYPVITYPPSTTSSIVNAQASTSAPQLSVQESTLSDSVMNTSRVIIKQKKTDLRFWKLSKKSNANDCPSSSSTSLSNVTSGFHSQMSEESGENRGSRWALPFSGTWDRT